jgi:hypothetical protein
LKAIKQRIVFSSLGRRLLWEYSLVTPGPFSKLNSYTLVSFKLIQNRQRSCSYVGTTSTKLAVRVPLPPTSSLITTRLFPTKLGHSGEYGSLNLEGLLERVKDVQYWIISCDTGAWVMLKGVKEGVVPLKRCE